VVGVVFPPNLSGFGPPTGSRSGFWTGREPNGPVVDVRFRTACVSPGPVANTILLRTCLEGSIWIRWIKGLSALILKERLWIILSDSLRFLWIYIDWQSFSLLFWVIDLQPWSWTITRIFLNIEMDSPVREQFFRHLLRHQ